MPVIYAFGCQFQVFDIYASVVGDVEHSNPNAGMHGIVHFVPVLLGAVAMMTLTFSLTGVFGVLTFPGQDIAGDVLTMLDSKGVLGNVARGVLVLACVLAAPLIVHPARAGWASCINGFSARPCAECGAATRPCVDPSHPTDRARKQSALQTAGGHT